MSETDFARLFQESGLQIGQYDQLLIQLYDGAGQTPPWSAFLEQMRSLLQANYVTMILRPPSPEHSWQVAFSGVAKPAIAELYNTFFYAVDPFVNLPLDRVVTVGEIVPEEDWLRSAIYREFLLPLGVQHYLGADLSSGGEVCCRLRVSRSKHAGNFSVHERAICQLLLPHIRNAVKLRSSIDVAEAERSLYAGALERLSVGAVILDKNGKIMHCNRAAEQILAERDGLSVVHDCLQASIGLESRELRQLIERAIRGDAGEQGLQPQVVSGMSLTRTSGRPNLGIVVRPAPLTEWSELPNRPAVLVIIRDAEQKLQASQSSLKQLYGFTPAESALVLKLLAGLTVDEASVELNISRNTARSQLRGVFAKTGVTRQTELVRLLLSGVAPLV